jgi:hypothetical protein
MAMTFSTLVASKDTVGSIKRWLNFTLVDSEELLSDAQAYIWGAMRVREMSRASTLAVAAAADSVAIPSDLLDPGVLLNEDGSKIELTSAIALMRFRQRETDGTTSEASFFSMWAMDRSLILFDAKADAAKSLPFVYTARPEALSASNETNFLTDRYPGILRAACLMHGASYRSDDEKYARYKMQADELIARANTEADLALRGAIFPVEIVDA